MVPGQGAAEAGSGRVVRGGSFSGFASDVRVSDRYGNTPGGRYDGVGFRLLRTIP